MYAIKPIMTAGLFAALGLAPAAFAQSTGAPPAAPSAQSTAPPAQSATTQEPSSTTPEQTNANQEAARQALAAARQSLAELTKLPAAQQLQGEQRTAVANFISDFNAFATAQNDWRSKYDVVDESLNRLLGDASSAAPSASTVGVSARRLLRRARQPAQPIRMARLPVQAPWIRPLSPSCRKCGRT